MTDEQREERACWKLEQGGYRVQKQGHGYLVTSPSNADDLEDLAQLVAFGGGLRARLDRQAHHPSA